MDATQQQALVDSQKEKNYAQMQTKLTQKISDKMDVIIDGLLNYAYTALEEIVNLLDEFFEMLASSKFFSSNQSDKDKDHKRLAKNLRGQDDPASKDLRRLLTENADASEKIVSAITKQLGTASAGDFVDMLTSVTATLKPEQQAEAIANSSLPDNIKKSLQDALQSGGMGGNLTSAAKKAGLSKAQMQALMAGAMGKMSEAQLVRLAQTASLTKRQGLGLTPGEGGPQAGESDDDSDTGQGVPAGAGQSSSGPPATSQAEQTVADNTAQIPEVVTAVKDQKPPIASMDTNMAKLNDQVENMTSGTTLNDLYNVLSVRGIKMNESFMKTKFWKEGHEQVLDANREALLEYFLYSTTMSARDVARRIKGGKSSARTFGADFRSDALSNDPSFALAGNATGGYVTGVQGGLAQIQRPAPGEGLASVGPGERIVPRGGGGGSLTIPINVNGPGGQELANVIKGHVMNGIAEYNRRSRFA